MIPDRPLLLLFITLLAAGGCSLDYQEMAESLDEETPSLQMSSVTVVTVEDNRERFRIDAEELADFEAGFKRLLRKGQFTEYSDSGEISARGRADSISLDTRTDDAVLEGNISFTSIEDKATVTADYLEWHDEARFLAGNPADEVQLLRENGTRVRGTGFSADFPSRTFSFSGRVVGWYVLDGEERTDGP